MNGTKAWYKFTHRIKDEWGVEFCGVVICIQNVLERECDSGCDKGTEEWKGGKVQEAGNQLWSSFTTREKDNQLLKIEF